MVSYQREPDSIAMSIRPRLIYGGRFDFWLAHVVSVERFIERHRLQPLDREHLVFDDPVPIVRRADEELVHWPRPFPGGKRIPHLHYKGEFFTVEPQQWEAFSKEIVEGFRTKLDHAGAIRVDTLVEMSDLIDGMG